LLHWEDFGASNARRILNKYAAEVCTFNDDMQGTAAVVMAAALAAVNAAGNRMRDQRVVIYGAGTAGCAIADMLRDVMISEVSRSRRPLGGSGSRQTGLLTTDIAELRDYQRPYARPAAEVAEWVAPRRPRRADACRRGGPC
jgi:malate dehydrogenase (oxaloacetate-decarboxylating)